MKLIDKFSKMTEKKKYSFEPRAKLIVKVSTNHPQQNQITVCAKIALKYIMWFTYLTRNGQEFTK